MKGIYIPDLESIASMYIHEIGKVKNKYTNYVLKNKNHQ